jgi:hypothetical protein
MGLLNGGIAAVFGAAFSGLYLDGTLHRGTGSPIYDATNGDITGYTGGGDLGCNVQTDRTGDAVKGLDGYKPGDVALIVLAHGLASTITSDHEITDGYGDRYRVHDVDRDAARSHFVCRGRPV